MSPAKNAPELDLVMTPPELAQEIIKYFKPSGTCMDPARGEGAFYDAIVSSGIKQAYWCEISAGHDFFDAERKIDWIITNPPWSKIRDFLAHAMKLADNVVFLATLVHFMTRARMRDIRDAGFGMRTALLLNQPPAPWPSSGFQLVAMRLQRGHKGKLHIDHSRL